MHATFQLYGNKICMVASERSGHMHLLISKVHMDLFDMHQSTISKLCRPDWMFGLLCNVAKFPLDFDAHSELIELGLCMSWQACRQFGHPHTLAHKA